MSRKRISLLIVAAIMAALMLSALNVAPTFGDVPPPPPPEEKVHCNAGNGNGAEYVNGVACDPGNSAPQNKGGDEPIGICPVANSQPNPGDNNVC